jgi:hypothetical protein
VSVWINSAASARGFRHPGRGPLEFQRETPEFQKKCLKSRKKRPSLEQIPLRPEQNFAPVLTKIRSNLKKTVGGGGPGFKEFRRKGEHFLPKKMGASPKMTLAAWKDAKALGEDETR